MSNVAELMGINRSNRCTLPRRPAVDSPFAPHLLPLIFCPPHFRFDLHPHQSLSSVSA
ncbi:hypothetical protein C8J55DRAFT_514191 [Lentinula edodes]|uniref:Uncharacterized protein n=1 Tax=Lentinula lateritia TaxID=40482 RepID=A0A9W9DP51_9AGAR|nr:hypothetical protein C8J55DRAFT_514191 [Lentinula edodes]